MQLSMFKKKNASLSVGARGFAPPAILFCISTYPIEILSRVVTFCDLGYTHARKMGSGGCAGAALSPTGEDRLAPADRQGATVGGSAHAWIATRQHP